MQAEGDVVRFPREAEAPPDFTAFFADEHRGLFKALYFVTGNRADAQELMQEAFLTLWERWDAIDRIDDPTGYLFRVALNGFRMRARAARRATRRLVAIDPSHDPFDEVDLREDVRRMLRSWRRGSAPPSSCSTCTAMARRTRPRSCGSAPPPCERSHPRAEPCSEPLEARMAELKELFEIATKQVEPDLDSWKDQERRQEQARRRRRIGAFAVAAAIGVAVVVVAIRAEQGSGTKPAIQPSPTPAESAVPETDYLIDLDDGETTPLPESIVSTGSYADEGGYAVSPDGSRLSYVGIGDDGVKQIFVANLDGTGVEQVTNDPGAKTPAWSPDGSRIAYRQ